MLSHDSQAVAHPLLLCTNAMKTPTAVALSLALLLGSAGARAGDRAQGGDASPSPPPLPSSAAPSATAPASPSPASSSPSLPPPLPLPPAPSGPPCRLAEHSGVEDADAATAAQLVCSALARAGAPLQARYRVALGKLGLSLILSVTLEGDTLGSTADMRELRLASIDEVPGAAPKIAGAIVHGTVIEDVDTAPPAAPPPEAPRPPAASSARIHFALGMIGQFPPLDRSATPAAGADLELHAEMSSFEIVTDVRFGGDDSDGSVGIVFVEFSMGARYFTSDADFSPFIGGGFAWSYLDLTDHVHNDFDGSHTGLGAYGEMGIEIGRTHHTHLAIGARLDLPFYSLNNDFDNVPVPEGNPGTSPPLVIGTLYYAPLSLEIRVTF